MLRMPNIIMIEVGIIFKLLMIMIMHTCYTLSVIYPQLKYSSTHLNYVVPSLKLSASTLALGTEQIEKNPIEKAKALRQWLLDNGAEISEKVYLSLSLMLIIIFANIIMNFNIINLRLMLVIRKK